MVKQWAVRWKKQILCILGSFLIFWAASLGEKIQDPVRQGYLERNHYGEDSRRYELLVEGVDEEPLLCQVDIAAVTYRQEEAETVFQELTDSLPQRILGENSSVDQIRTDLNLLTWFDDTGVKAVWQSRNPDVIDSYGHITAENLTEKGEKAILQVTLTDGVYRREEDIELQVRPPLRSEQEQAAAFLERQIRQADKAAPAERQVALPGEYNGKRITYRDANGADYGIIPFLGAVLAVLFYIRERMQEKEEKKKRDRLLQLDYGDVVYQMMVYTGAGLTVRKTWEQMVENYERRKAVPSQKARPAYEEMAVTLRQIQYGEPEGKAIAEFGRRCGLQPYRKLGSLLEQNRKTGTKNLARLLEQEMSAAWEQQKHEARRMGEEAGTKLLIPLFLMLLVVMVIIMVPALMAIG